MNGRVRFRIQTVVPVCVLLLPALGFSVCRPCGLRNIGAYVHARNLIGEVQAAAFDGAGIVQNPANPMCRSHSSLSPTMGSLNTLAVLSFFFVSSFAASASDWHSRSIYQVNHIPRLLTALTLKVTSLSRTGLHSRMGLGQLVTQGTSSIVVAATKVS